MGIDIELSTARWGSAAPAGSGSSKKASSGRSSPLQRHHGTSSHSQGGRPVSQGVDASLPLHGRGSFLSSFVGIGQAVEIPTEGAVEATMSSLGRTSPRPGTVEGQRIKDELHSSTSPSAEPQPTSSRPSRYTPDQTQQQQQQATHAHQGGVLPRHVQQGDVRVGCLPRHLSVQVEF